MALSDWTISRKLSGGGQGETSVVSNKLTSQLAVMKKMKNSGNPKARARFAGEVAALEAVGNLGLDVPTLIDHNLFDNDQNGDRAFICMEYVEGPTVSEFIKKKPLPEDQAVDILIPLLRTVTVLHANGILHRDIKPGNIIVQQNGVQQRLMLVDFGLAYDKEAESELTDPLENVGNRFLMLPETHYPAGPKHDARSDICQLTGILYFLITGEHPRHLGLSRFQAPHHRSEGQKVNFSSELSAVFDKGFSYEIENRFQSVSELISNLESIRKKEMIEGSDVADSEEHYPLANGTFFYRCLIDTYENQSLLGISNEFLSWIFEFVESYTLYRVAGQGILAGVKKPEEISEYEVDLISEVINELRERVRERNNIDSDLVLSEAEAHFYSSTFDVECERALTCCSGQKNCITAAGPVFSCFRSHPGARNVYHFKEVINRLDPNFGKWPPRIFRFDESYEKAICWRCGQLR